MVCLGSVGRSAGGARVRRLRDVLRPPFGGIEGDDPLRVVILPREQVLDDRIEVGRVGIRFAPDESGSKRQSQDRPFDRVRRARSKVRHYS